MSEILLELLIVLIGMVTVTLGVWGFWHKNSITYRRIEAKTNFMKTGGSILTSERINIAIVIAGAIIILWGVMLLIG